MRKTVLILFSVVLILLIVSAIAFIAFYLPAENRTNETNPTTTVTTMDQDHIIVSDDAGQVLGTISDPTYLNEWTEMIAKNGDAANLQQENIKDGKIAYRYTFKQVRKDGKVNEVHAVLYEGESLFAFKDLPVVGDLLIPLSEQEEQKLRHPETYFD